MIQAAALKSISLAVLVVAGISTPLPSAEPSSSPGLISGFSSRPRRATPAPVGVPVPADVVYGPVMNGWKVGLQIAPASAPLDSETLVRIVLTNVNAAHARVVEPNSPCGYGFTVTDLSSRETVQSGCATTSDAAGGVPIGASLVESFTLRQLHAREDFRRHLIDHSGRYSVTVVRIIDKDDRGVRLLPVKSNAVTVTISD